MQRATVRHGSEVLKYWQGGCYWNSDVFWGIVKQIATEAQEWGLPFLMFVYQAQ